MDITKTDYAPFFEDCIKSVMEYKPEAMCFAAITKDGFVLTGYHNCGQQDKAIMAHNIYTDAMMDVIKTNAKDILEAAEGEENDG